MTSTTASYSEELVWIESAATVRFLRRERLPAAAADRICDEGVRGADVLGDPQCLGHQVGH